MKNFVILIFLCGVAFICLGSFTVNVGENAFVISKIDKTRYYDKPGLYFAIPIVEKVDYIYVNNREAVFSTILTVESSDGYKLFVNNQESSTRAIKISLLTNWHVDNAKDYYNYLQKNGQLNFNQSLVENISNVLLERINGLAIESLNQLNTIVDHSMNLPTIGVNLDKISILSVEPVDNTVPSPEILVESVAKSPIHNNSSLDLQNKMIESAYYQAAMIKTQTEIEEARAYGEIKKESPKFYNYFRLINVYKDSAKNKADVPPFKSLYY